MKKEWPGCGVLCRLPDIGFEEYIRRHGTGSNQLRTSRIVQPAALRVGDVLATGDKVLSLPREGGNGSVLIHLTGGFEGHWIDVPARIPMALFAPEDDAPEAIRSLGTPMHVVSIFIAPEAGVSMEEVSEIEVSPERGLHGDRYGVGRGAWSKPGDEADRECRMVSFIELEGIEGASPEMIIPLTPGETRRNILTHGIRLNELVGKEFAIRTFQGNIRFFGTRLCEPCDRPPKLAGKVVPSRLAEESFRVAYKNCGGLRAKALNCGTIHYGNEIVLL